MCFWPIFVCLLSVAFLCVPVPFLFFCVFIVSSLIMGQSSSTPLSVMTDHEDWESQKKKLILLESSLYPSLIDLDTEISPPPYMKPPLSLQVPQGSSVEQRRDPEPSAPPWEGVRSKELVEGLEGAETCLRTEARRLLHPPFGHSLSGWGQQIPVGSEHTRTGHFLQVIYITGKLKPLLFLKDPKVLLIS